MLSHTLAAGRPIPQPTVSRHTLIRFLLCPFQLCTKKQCNPYSSCHHCHPPPTFRSFLAATLVFLATAARDASKVQLVFDTARSSVIHRGRPRATRFSRGGNRNSSGCRAIEGLFTRLGSLSTGLRANSLESTGAATVEPVKATRSERSSASLVNIGP
ncbi:hypothetical protein C8R45DRAFT_1024363 [Mycena sanguinolenta]|nr:hypothetical protein C8R45DRAFT_1024363 [Mycena sanguinolenta]